MSDGFVILGADRLPYPKEAIEMAGMRHGQRIESMEQWGRLRAADHAVFEASCAIFHAQMRALVAMDAN